jgi:hypothetical protein
MGRKSYEPGGIGNSAMLIKSSSGNTLLCYYHYYYLFDNVQ